jgi:hypothetical protein
MTNYSERDMFLHRAQSLCRYSIILTPSSLCAQRDGPPTLFPVTLWIFISSINTQTLMECQSTPPHYRDIFVFLCVTNSKKLKSQAEAGDAGAMLGALWGNWMHSHNWIGLREDDTARLSPTLWLDQGEYVGMWRSFNSGIYGLPFWVIAHLRSRQTTDVGS